ncbi:MAG: c-type cytochrome [Methylobacteriaceae bacterium]|nr:c-type cytochrome [Methylobacteriaceae bacterium]
MIRSALALGFVLALGAGPATAQSTPGAPPPPATAPAAAADAGALDGKALYRTKTCIACHGRDGSRAIQNFPELAGQDARYMLAQTNEIADGKRVSGPDARGYPRTQGMKDVMHLVSVEERAAITDYLSKLPAPKPRPLDPPIDEARKAAGKDAYLKGGCITCHGPEGNKPLAAHPYLGGMKRDYLVLQTKEIRDGVRKSPKLAAMMPFARKLDDEKILLIADYLSQIERPAR